MTVQKSNACIVIFRSIQSITHQICSIELLQCDGSSMEPALYTNNVLLIDCITPRYGSIVRGDIIIAKSPNDPQTHICKRVVGLPGDEIKLKPRFNLNPFSNSKSTVNEINDFMSFSNAADIDDAPNVSNHDLSKRTFQSTTIIVPRGHVWLEGDNYQQSYDSRMYGPVPMGLVNGRVICRLWPFSEAKKFI